MEKNESANRRGVIPVGGPSPVGKEIGAAMELLVGYEGEALMPSHIEDSQMECGGRDRLHQIIELRKNRPSLREKVELPCGTCAVQNACPFGT